MQIILPQSELEEAVRETVLSQISIREDQTISMVFEETDSGVIAIIEVTKNEDASEAAPVRKTRAKRKSKKAAEPVTEAQEETKPEAKEEPKDLPWEEDKAEGTKEEEKPVQTTVAPEKAAEEVSEKASVSEAPKIFPDATSSTPVSQKTEPETPPAKSLFANLTKPVNGGNGANGTNGSANGSA